MDIQSLIDHLHQKNVLLTEEQGQLRIYSDTDLAPDFINNIRHYKQDILARLISTTDKSIKNTPSSSNEQEQDDKIHSFPLTDMQQAYWLGRRSDFLQGNSAANFYGEFEIKNEDVDKIENAWNALLKKHKNLCTQITKNNRQQIAPVASVYSIKKVDYSGLDKATKGERLLEVRKRIAYKNRDQAGTCLFDLQISQVSDRLSLLHVSIDSIIIDFISFIKLCCEWAEIVESNFEITPPETDFPRYLKYLQTKQNSTKYEKSKSYWRKRIRTLPLAPKIQITGSPCCNDKDLFSFNRQLNDDQWSEIKKQARLANVTPTIFFLYLYAETINYFAETPSFLLNVTFSDRDNKFDGVQDLLGNFTNLLPFELDFKVRKTCLERLQDIKNRLLHDIDHRSFTGIEIMREVSQLRMSAQTLPMVFSSAVDNNKWVELGQTVYLCNPTPQVQIHNYIYQNSDGVKVCLEFDNLTFSKSFVDQFTRLYNQLLDDVLNQNLGEYPLSGLNQCLLPDQYNNSEIRGKNLHDLFLEALPSYSGHTAIISDQTTMTYRELYRRSLQLAEKISQYNLGHDTPIAIIMEKGWEQVVAVYGVLFAGHAFLPIDATYPEARQKIILQQSKSSLVITQPEVAAKNSYISEYDHEIVYEENLPTVTKINSNDLYKNEFASNKAIKHVDSNKLAYIIYTSGSTGKPKGVMISHDAALNTIVDINRRFSVAAEDRVLAISSLSFDLSIYDIFAPLAVGAAIVLPRADHKQDPKYLLSTISNYNITIWNSVPALFDRLYKFAQMNNARLPLRLVMLSGDWIPVDMAASVKRSHPNLQLISLGGATEASIWSIFHEIIKVHPEWKSIPYGKALSDQSVYVLDHDLRERPIGVAGEIYIGGRGVALGYHHDFERTQERFLNHPVTGERLYKTGDLGKYLNNNDIEILGRADFQVKVNGYRIELEEIEACINEIDGIARSLVLPKRDCLNQINYLVAFYLVDTDIPEVDRQSRIKEHLQQQLPDYMVPYQFIRLDEFPLTGNGKIDRRALNQLIVDEPVNIIENRAVNEVLQGFVKEILEVDSVDESALFFELGLTSIHMVVLQDKIRKYYNIDIDVVRFFQHPTLQQFSRYLASRQNATADDSISIIETSSARAKSRRQRHAIKRTTSKHTQSEHISNA